MTMAETLIHRSAVVAEIICDHSPVARPTTPAQEPSRWVEGYQALTAETIAHTAAITVRVFCAGCGRPSVFRVRWRCREETVWLTRKTSLPVPTHGHVSIRTHLVSASTRNIPISRGRSGAGTLDRSWFIPSPLGPGLGSMH